MITCLMDVFKNLPGYKHFLILVLFAQYILAIDMNGCKCSTSIDERSSCHCEGMISRIDDPLTEGALQKLSLENGNFSYFLQNTLHHYKEGLEELTITRSNSLEHINSNVLQDMPSLNSLRVTHTSLQYLPHMEGLGMNCTMRLIDLESNKIKMIMANTMIVSVDQLFLDYNLITSIDGWAFKGSEIGKLSLKGNRGLRELSKNSFTGIKSLRDLDLSETSISYLPTQGLENLEILRIKDTYTLKIIPSIYDLNKLQTALLTYSFHCCAFYNPEKHDPERHKEYNKMRKNLCKDDPVRSERDMFDDSFGDIMEYSNESFFNPTEFFNEKLVNGENANLEDDQKTDGIFHNTSAPVPNIPIHAVCGDLTGKIVSCLPKADALNPCEDMMSWTWLRISVWFVLSTAIFGNIAVLIILCLSRTEKSVPRYLMCNLAFADLVMAIYLTMLAIMDVASSESYFNYAYNWQRGIGCKIAGFLTVFASQFSLFTLSLLTIERWFAIRHALYMNFLDLKLTRSIMMAGWIYSIFMAILPLFGVSSYSSTSICLPMDTHNRISQGYIILMVFIAGCSFILMCVCYVQIYLSLSEETRHSIGEGSVARKMTILVGTNFICWAPVAFFTLTAVAGYPFITVSQSKILLVFIYPINSCANPYLYAILTKQFRKDFMTITSRYIKCKQSYHYKLGYARPARNDTSIDTRAQITTAETLL